MWRADSLERPWCWERWQAGEGDNRGWDGWMDMSLSKLLEIVEDREGWHAAVHGVAKCRTCLSEWTTQQRIRAHWGSSWFWYHEGPCGGPGLKAFVSPISLLIERAFMIFTKFQPAGSCSCYSKGTGWDQRERVKSSFGVRSCFPIKGYTQQYLWAILQILKPSPRSYGMLPTNE